ncbi:MAG TPA: prolyl oligopeptidase family serine peptidase [Candidatus Paceibacterota bacterium]|nr:prolyl oligopeptidase family serine peptidase [Candidatus Paceibacterota bacterium]
MDEPKFLLEVPEGVTDKVVVFLPGITGGALTGRFQLLVDVCLRSHIAIARVNLWKDAKDVAGKTLNDLHTGLDEIISLLRSKGYISICIIGKSFGATVLLTSPSLDVAKIALWSPAITVVDFGNNINEWMTKPLSALSSVLSITVDKKYLERKQTNTLIIHGTGDDKVPFSNSEKMATYLPNVHLVAINGADHSYSDKNHELVVVTTSINFFNKE